MKSSSSDPWANEPKSGVKTPMLYSYAHLKDWSEEEQANLIVNPAFEVLIDSGGFSALNAGYEINLNEYIEWLLKWEDHLYAYVALDKLGDSKQTDINLRIMQDAGLSPVPVHVRGDDEKRMDELFEMSDYVAIGGLRRPHRGQASYQYVAERMRWAKGRKVHWLGWTQLDAIAHFKPHSVDCSSWASGLRYGTLRLYENRARWFDQMCWGSDQAGKSIEAGYKLSPRESRVVRNAGVPESWVYDERRWRHCREQGVYYDNSALSVLAGHSWVRFTDDIRRFWGTRHFIACSVLKAKYLQPLHWADQLYKHGRACLEDYRKLPEEAKPPEVTKV